MTTDLIFSITIIVMFAIHEYMMEREKKQAREERQRILEMAQEEQNRLLDRIQARDLPEYKAVNTPRKPIEPKKPTEEIFPV